MWVYDLETMTVLAVNDAALDQYGHTRENLLGSTIDDVRQIPVAASDAAAGDAADAFPDGDVRWHRLRDGRVAQVQVAPRVLALDGRRARLAMVRGVVREADDAHGAQQPPGQSDEQFRQLADAMPLIVWTAEPNGTIDYVSQAFYAYVGVERIDLPAREWLQAIHPEDVERSLAAWGGRIGDGAPGAIELRLRRGRDGSSRWHQVTVKPIRDGAGTIVKWFGSASDIHERKLAVEKLQESEERLHALFESEPQGMALIALDGQLLDLNPAGLRMIERDDGAQVIGTPMVQLVRPDDLAVYRQVHDTAAGGDAARARLRMLGARGGERWVEIHAVPMRRRAGAVASILGILQDVTDRRQAELALAATRRQTELILESIADGVLVLGTEGGVLRQNPAAAAMLGWTDAEVVGRNVQRLVRLHAAGAEPGPLDAHPIADTLRDGQTRRVEHEIFSRRDGAGFPVEYVCSSVRDDSGAVGGAVVSFRDVAERRRQELTRTLETEILRMISGGTSLPDVLLRIVLAIEVLAGQAIASVVLLDVGGRHIRRGVAPHLPEAFTSAIDGLPIGPAAGSCGTAMHRGEAVIVGDIMTDPLWADYRALAAAHGLRACWSWPVKGATGAVLASFALYHREPRMPTGADMALISRFADIVAIAIERIRIVDSLRQSEQRFQAVSAAIADVIWDWDLVHDTLWWSEDFERVFGYPPSVVASGPAWLACIHPDDRDRVDADARKAIAHRDRFWACEYRFLCRDGTVLDIEDRGCLILDQEGTAVRFVGGMSDITVRKRAQRELRERMKELRCLYRVLELTSDPGRPVGDICQDVASILPQSLWYEDVAVAGIELEGVVHRSDGWRAPVVALRVPIGGLDAPIGYVEAGYAEAVANAGSGSEAFLKEEREMLEAVAAHIGRMLDGRQMAARLTQSERLRAVGELTGGVAHDFNNLLTVILGNAELLADDLEAQPHLCELARMTQNAAERAAELTRHLLAFSRRQALTPAVTDVAALVGGMSALLRRALGEHVEIETVCRSDLWQALVDPAQLESAVLNLSINARDAMPGGGALMIELSNVHLNGGGGGWEEEPATGDYVLVAVSDTGTGMTADVLARVFEPFFTTKETGKGSGLGLSMVYGFARQSKGQIKITSEPGRGTTVRLFLPRALAESDGAEAGAPDAEVPHGVENILLVEDDDMVRSHVCGQLEALGYRVVSVRDGVAALDALQQGGGFDLLFTDLVMPGGINGRQLADAARRLWPRLPVLFTSGYAEGSIMHDDRLDAGVHLLSKPYRRAELAAKVREVLGAGG